MTQSQSGADTVIGTAKLFPPSGNFSKNAHITSREQYDEMYRRSIEDPDAFWSEIASDFYWKEPWTQVREFDFTDEISIRWFIGAKTNICYNALDRHLDTRGGQVAILDPNADLGGFVSLFLDDGHTSAAADVVAEMQTAGFRSVQSFDFLLTQIFELFATGMDVD